MDRSSIILSENIKRNTNNRTMTSKRRRRRRKRTSSSSSSILTSIVYLMSFNFNKEITTSAFVQPRRNLVIRTPLNQYNNKKAYRIEEDYTKLSVLYMSSTNGEVNGSGGGGGNNTPPKLEPQVYPQRWTQLIYLSLLALLSDWICFSVAASPESFEHAYPGSGCIGG